MARLWAYLTALRIMVVIYSITLIVYTLPGSWQYEPAIAWYGVMVIILMAVIDAFHYFIRNYTFRHTLNRILAVLFFLLYLYGLYLAF